MFNQKSIFFKETLENSYDLQVKTLGYSMFPFIKYGDSITISSLKDSPKIGDLILFKKKEKLILHRLIKIKYNSGPVFITKGDSSFNYDEPIIESEILGKAIEIKRKGKLINLESKKYRIINYFLSKISFLRIFRLYWIIISLLD